MRVNQKSLTVLFFLGNITWVSAIASPQEKALSGSTIVVRDTLNVAAVRREYKEGNFESLTQALETFRGQGHVLRHQDSLIVAKYLGVICAADPATREKGKYWLYKMLEMDPGAGIVDLFVSEEIHSTFERARQELNLQKQDHGSVISPMVSSSPGNEMEKSDAPAGNAVPIQRNITSGQLANRHWTWNLNLMLGQKTTSDQWRPVNVQGGVKLGFDLRRRSWPVGMFIDFIGTNAKTKDSVKFKEAGGVEVVGGVRKTWDRKFRIFRPYLGAGLGFVGTAVDTGTAPVWYRGRSGLRMEAGMRWELWKHFNLGVDVSATFSSATFRGKKTNPAGNFGGLLVGYHF